MLKMGMIGCGARSVWVAKFICDEGEKDEIKVVAVADPGDEETVKWCANEAKFNGYDDFKLYKSAEEMLENEKLDGVIVGTRCNLHTKYAELVAKYDIPLYLEKPVATTVEDLEKLKKLMHMNEKTVVSFPLRVTTLSDKAKEILASGALGTISQVQAWNNVPYGLVYYKDWYRDDSVTGGLFLQKMTHDFDYINYVIKEGGKRSPIRVCAMQSKLIFKGDMPAGQKCADCPKKADCLEEVEKLRAGGEDVFRKEDCCFAEDTGNQDCGSILLQYDDGLHVSYTQNFVVRKGKFTARRGMRIIGYLATLEFDLYDGKVYLTYHHDNRQEVFAPNDCGGSHMGGDKYLAKSFVEVMSGTGKSVAPLYDGILSANVCLMARESAENYKFMDIKF